MAEGRKKIAQGGIDTAIVDIPLPDEGAEGLVRELYEANTSIPILVMTVIEEREVHERFLEAGPARYSSRSQPLRKSSLQCGDLGARARGERRIR